MVSKHQTLVDLVAEHCKAYDLVIKNKEYNNKGYYGEFDVLTKRTRSDGSVVYHYYEIKSNYSVKSYKRAVKQFERCLKAFPNLEWRFIYVTPQKIMRWNYEKN